MPLSDCADSQSAHVPKISSVLKGHGSCDILILLRTLV